MKAALLIYSSLTSHFALKLTYMLQRVDYQPMVLWRWLVRAGDLHKVQKRGAVKWTIRAKLVYLAITLLILTYCIVNLLTMLAINDYIVRVVYAVSALALFPFIIVVTNTTLIIMARFILVTPKEKAAIKRARSVYASLTPEVVAVAGSYGKTTMKELLLQVLGAQFKVQATYANSNTLGSIAALANNIQPDTQFVIVEYGEAYPGDIFKATDMTKPTYAFVTGLAPNHLDHYKTLEAITQDLGYLVGFVDPQKLYINGECSELAKAMPMGAHYTKHGINNIRVTSIETKIRGTTVRFTHKKKPYEFTAQLLGAHNVGPLLAVVDFCVSQGMTIESIIAKIEQLEPHEHRMSVRPLGRDSWFIDDTYNGNLHGLLAGLELLSQLHITGKKIYITPGLVDQGQETERVHTEIGRAIAKANPDEVVLFDNSVREYIEKSARKNGYAGSITIETDAVQLVSSLDSITAAGDVVLWQNDWPDEYN